MTDDSYILIGKIKGTHGLDGNLKVESYAESIDLFGRGVSLKCRNSTGTWGFYTVKNVKPYKQGLLLRFDEVQHINTAETLVGSDVFIQRDLLPETEEGEFYWFEIIGLSVYSTDGSYLGKVISIFPTGSNDVYVVRNDEREEILVPALESVLVSIDPAAGTMIVDLPEGL